MTTLTMGSETSFVFRTDQVPTEGVSVRLAPDVGAASEEFASVRVRSVGSRNAREFEKPKKVLRRMQGFLIEMLGEEAKVALVEAGTTYEYYLPSKHLKKAGIQAENQPFQMDEIEIKTEASVIVGYEFQALAKPSDAFQDSFELDGERERKRKLILQVFKDAEA